MKERITSENDHNMSTIETGFHRKRLNRKDSIDTLDSLYPIVRKTATTDTNSNIYLQEDIIYVKQWRGQIVKIYGKYVEAEVVSAEDAEISRMLRVKKNVIEDYSDDAYIGCGITVTHKSYRDFNDKLIETVCIRLNAPAKVPETVIKKRVQMKMERYAYMFGKKDSKD